MWSSSTPIHPGFFPGNPIVTPLAPAPPACSETRAAIERLAAYTARNGPDFEAMIMEQQRYNPGFRFLFDRNSMEYGYYRWMVHHHQQPAAPPMTPAIPPSGQLRSSQAPWHLTQHPPSPSIPVQPNIEPIPFSSDKWESILSSIDISKGSVKFAADWLFRCALNSEASSKSIDMIEDKMRSFGFEPEEFSSKLALLYLINEILHRSKSDGVVAAHPIIAECCRHLGSILQRTYAMNSPSNQQQVESIVEMWRQRAILPPTTCDVIRAQMVLEVATTPRDNSLLEPPEYTSPLPDLPPNAVLASTLIVLPSEVAEACSGAAPYTTLNQLAFSALARRSYLGSTRDRDKERQLLDSFYDEVELRLRGDASCSRDGREQRDGHSHREHRRRIGSQSSSPEQSRDRYRRHSSSTRDERHYRRRSRSVSHDRSHSRASRSRSWSRGRSPSPT